MARQLWALTLLGLVGTGAGLWPGKLESFRSETELNHLVVDNASGVVYLGAVNALYQLSADLRLEQQAATGPALDHKKCTPPIEASQCHEAVLTNNVNQLLLLDPPGARLVECGSLFKGICALRSLANISTRLFYEDGSGEKSFVASNDESVATVGLVSATDSNGERVLFVGKGNGPHDNGVIVSTRLLDRAHGREAFEAYTDHATYKAGYLSTNTQQFVAAFEDSRYVFFLFNQQDKHPPQNRTLLARMCKQDPYYYSYLEMDLQCLDRSDAPATAFSTCLAASVATSGAGRVLYAVFSRDVRRGGGPRAGLCLFPLEEVHAKMQAIRDACYTDTREAGRDIFYKPFHGEIQCGGHLLGASESFLCGSEHLPYPLGSREGLTANAVLQRGGLNLTAVTVTTENSHTIAFLGTSDGQVLKVYLAPDGSSAEYGSILVERNKRVKQDLVLSADLASLYAMTHHKVFRLPVQECLSYVACAQCLRSQDPYCGWCVVEGRCTRRAECPRAEESGHWLWSREESCVAVTGAQPQNMSRRAKGEVQLTVSPLPALSKEDGLLCLFGDSPPHAARVEGDTVICDSPSSIPSTPPGQDHVAMNIQLLFKQSSVFLTSHLYPFYDCRKAMSLAENLPCISCASNRWTCQWDLRYHECREASPNPEDGIVPAHMEDSCPQFLNPSPLVIPMNHETEVTFQGKNLDTVKSPSLQVGSDLIKFEETVSTQEPETFVFRTPKLSHDGNETLPLHLFVKSYGKNIDSKLQVTLYNCSFGRSDCSLCLAADPAYKCVWCSGQSRCVYEALCSNATSECPPPVITRVSPLGLPAGRGGGSRSRPTCTARWPRLPGQPGSADFRSGVPCKVTQFGAQLQCVTGPQVALGELPLEVHYGGSHVPSPGVTFTYRENPVLLSFQPLRSFVSGGRSINVTGQGFSLIQRFAMVVIAEPLQSWQRQREAGPLQPITVVGTEYEFHNDSRVVFLSPAVPEEPEAYNLTVLIQMDGHRALLRTEAGAFEYVADPTFENFTGGVRKQVNKLIHAQGTNLNKAMTLHEAKAFVGAECCVMKTLTETDLYCEPPEVQPPPKRRQKRDTAHNLPEFIVRVGAVDAVQKKAKYTLNDTGLLGDDVEYAPLTVSVIVQDEGVDAIPVKVLNCDTISQVKEKIIDQVYRTQPCSRWPKADSVVLEWRPGSTAQILSDLDLTSQREGRWKRINTLMHYNVRDGATLILSKVGVSQQPEDSQQDLPGERHALLEEENRVWHLVRPTEEVEEGKCKRGSVKEKERTKAITEIYLTRLLSVKGTLQQFVDNFFQSVLAPEFAVPPAVKYFFDFLDEQAEKHDIKDEDTIHIWKTNSLPLRFWVNILKNPHFIFDVHVHEVVDASLSVIAQTFMDACTRTEHKLSRDSPSNKLLYAKEISTYKKMVEDYYKGIRQMVQVSDQDMNTHLAEISRAHTDSLNTLVALHQLYQYTQKYYDEVISALEEDPAAQKMQLAFRLQQIAAALENKVTDL
ncbi:plexin-B2 [Pteropus vampyrus]|uniref:Plexin-B2 n=1 Tax=Pteropus vampyrus TaxID=132908 RepID=A0A6P6C1C5_PTEVA|nr:plexin-B2 [Pteropus vampyrus]